MNQVAMTINQTNLVKSLKLSFTNKTTVLGELMQNARRAGATSVNFEFAPETKTLRVMDNGCGIDSIETLLTVAESGWDADVIAQEHPFGIGFLSALFACRHMIVVSKSGRIAINTDDVLSFKPVKVSPVTAWDGITSITMLGVDLDIGHIERELKRLATAFPIPVLLNQTELDRPHAVDSGLEFVNTEIGSISLFGLDKPNLRNSAYVMYLQGLPIYDSSYYAHFFQAGYHVIHLDSTKFFGRLPDRDELVNKDDVVNLVKATLKCEIEKRLIEMKSNMSPEAFVVYYDMISDWGLLPILNDVPVIPIRALTQYLTYPNCSEESFGSFTTCPENLVHQDDVMSGRCRLVTFDEDLQDEGAALSMYVFKNGFYVYPAGSAKLDEGHWLHNNLRNLNKESVRIELINETHSACFNGLWISLDAVFCQSYRIWVGDDSVEIDDCSMFDGSKAIVPYKDTSGLAVSQASPFSAEDDFQLSAYEQDQYDFSQFVIANISSDPSDALQKLLPNFSGCPMVYGKSFIITIDQFGRVASTHQPKSFFFNLIGKFLSR